MLAAIPIIEAAIALLGEVPSLMAALSTVKTLITENRDPTPDEQAQFDKALDDALAATPKT